MNKEELIALAISMVLVAFFTIRYFVKLIRSRKGFAQKTREWIEKIIESLF